MPLQRFSRGDALTTGNLNPIVDACRRMERTPGAPASSPGFPAIGREQLRVTVVARNVSGPAPLAQHGYVVTAGGEQWDVDPSRLVVKVEYPLVIDQDKPMGFWPADVAGRGLAVIEPWRAWGTLYRGPDASGQPDFAVELFGLCPARGC